MASLLKSLKYISGKFLGAVFTIVGVYLVVCVTGAGKWPVLGMFFLAFLGFLPILWVPVFLFLVPVSMIGDFMFYTLGKNGGHSRIVDVLQALFYLLLGLPVSWMTVNGYEFDGTEGIGLALVYLVMTKLAEKMLSLDGGERDATGLDHDK